MSAAVSPSRIGEYEVLGKIAEGGMGVVWKARHPVSREVVAIKVVPAETARNPTLVRRFEQEFRAASLIDHPNVVRAIEYGAGSTPFLVMEYVAGESLGQKVDRDGALPEADAVRVISQVCEGLHRAHKQGLIHRDVKPDNILVTPDGVAKLTDLGLVKDVEADHSLTRTGRGLGTPHFMAPEQFRNAKNADVRCDVYSLGATLYTAVTGEVPFNRTSPLDCWVKKTKGDFPPPRELAPGLGERVDWAIRRAMHPDPARRPANCREFMEDLTGASWRGSQASGLFVGAADPPASEPADLWYVVYKDPAGQPRTVKGGTDSIRRNVRAGAVGPPEAVLVCRSKHGQFLPLRAVPAFRDLAVEAEDAVDLTVTGPPPSGRYVVAPEAAASLSGKYARPPAESADTRHDTTEQYTITPLSAPPADRPAPPPGPSPAARLLPWVVVSLLSAAAGGAAVYLLVR